MKRHRKNPPVDYRRNILDHLADNFNNHHTPTTIHEATGAPLDIIHRVIGELAGTGTIRKLVPTDHPEPTWYLTGFGAIAITITLTETSPR